MLVTNTLWRTMTSQEEMASLTDHTEITRNLAVLTGIDSQMNIVKSLNQELIKVGGGHPLSLIHI